MLHKLAAVKVIQELEVREIYSAEGFEMKNCLINFYKEITALGLKLGIVILFI